MSYEIPGTDLEMICEALKASPDPEVQRARNQLYSQCLTEDLKRFDPPEEFKDYIRKLSAYLKVNFRLEDWAQHLGFREADLEAVPGAQVHACIQSNRTYLYFTLTICPVMLELWRKKDFVTIGFDLCHEFCHILTDPIVAFALRDVPPSHEPMIQEVNERQVQRFSVIIGTSLPDQWWMPEQLDAWIAKHPEVVLCSPSL